MQPCNNCRSNNFCSEGFKEFCINNNYCRFVANTTCSINVGDVYKLKDVVCRFGWENMEVKVLNISYIKQYNENLITFIETKEYENKYDAQIGTAWESVFIEDFKKKK